MCNGAHDENDKMRQARELKLMRKTISILERNTLWTMLGACSGWAGIGIALYIILFN